MDGLKGIYIRARKAWGRKGGGGVGKKNLVRRNKPQEMFPYKKPLFGGGLGSWVSIEQWGGGNTWPSSTHREREKKTFQMQ